MFIVAWCIIKHFHPSGAHGRWWVAQSVQCVQCTAVHMLPPVSPPPPPVQLYAAATIMDTGTWNIGNIELGRVQSVLSLLWELGNTQLQLIRNFILEEKQLYIIHNIIVYEQLSNNVNTSSASVDWWWLMIGTEAIESSGPGWRVSDVLRVVAVMEFLIHHRLELFSNYAPLCSSPHLHTSLAAAPPSSKVMTQPDQEPSLPISTPSPTGDPSLWIHGLYKAEL